MGRLPMYNNSIYNNELMIKKGPWTPEEDHILINHIEKHGRGNWQLLPKRAGLNRFGRSCRLRWTNYLRPDIKRGNFSIEEQQTIIHLHSILGNKWSRIATKLPGRTDNEIKNFWNTHIRKKLMLSGIDPQTHQPIPKFAMHHDSNFKNLIMNNIAKIQLLCNILQTLNTNPVPNFYMESPPYHQHFDHPIEVPSTVPNMVNDKKFVFGDFEPIWNSISTSCAGSIPEFSGTNHESTISGSTSGYSPPVFVPTTPGVQFLGTFDNLGMDGDDAISFWKDIYIQSSSSL